MEERERERRRRQPLHLLLPPFETGRHALCAFSFFLPPSFSFGSATLVPFTSTEIIVIGVSCTCTTPLAIRFVRSSPSEFLQRSIREYIPPPVIRKPI